MSCVCASKLMDLLKALLAAQIPAITLPAIPPLAANLSMMAGGLGAASAAMSMSAQLSLLANLSLPPLPMPPAMLMNLAALGPSVSAIHAGLGVHLMSPTASMQLAVAIGSLNLNMFPMPALPNIAVGPLFRISGLCSLVSSIRLAFGIDLLAPGAVLALQARLNAMAALALPPFPAGAMGLSIAASLAASLGINLALPGGMAQLTAALRFMASLQLPKITIPLLPLAELLALLAALANIQAVTGINLFLPGASLHLAARLAPLAALASLQLSANLSAMAAAGMSFAPLLPALSMNLRAMAGLNLGALAIPLPNLGPLTLAAQFALATGATSNSACSPSCPVALHL